MGLLLTIHQKVQRKDEEWANSRRKWASITMTSWKVNSIISLKPKMILFEEIPNGEWSLFSISVVYHLRFIGLKGLGQMPHYGQHKSSHELTNTGQKSPYLVLTQFTISWAPISKGQRWEILCIKEHYFLKKILRKYGFLTNIPLSTQLALEINSPDGEGYLGQCFSSFHVPINYLGFLLNCQFQF